VIALVLGVAVIFAGCNVVSGIQRATGLGGTNVAVEPGTVKGRVTYTDGRPVTDAKIYVTNQDYGGGPTVSTDAGGNYSAKAPAGNYRVSGSVQRQYHGKVFHLGLEPQGHDTNFRIENGYVMNFVFKVSGAVPDSPNPDNLLLGYWGMAVEVIWEDSSQTDRTARQIPAGAKVEMTFTPKAALIDGSTGKTKVYELNYKASGSGTYIVYSIDPVRDLPGGDYTITARLSGSASTPLKVSLAGFGRPMSTSETLEATPNSIGISPYSESCCERVSLRIWPGA